MRSAVGQVPETDSTVASQSSYTKVFASDGSFLDVCGELIGVGQNRPAHRSPLSLTFCGERFATFSVILPCTVTLRRSSMPDYWRRTHRSFKCHFLYQNLLYSQQDLPFASSHVKVLPLKPGVGKYIAIHTTLTARDIFLANFYPSGPFTCIFPKPLLSFSCASCG